MTIMANETFEHPKFGTLHSEDGGYLWNGKITLPAFGQHGWKETLQIQIYGEEAGPPDPDVFALLEPLIANASRLPDLIVDALWNELSGGESENGHWWARPGGLETVNEGLDEPITKRDDLWGVLRPNALFVQKDVHGDGQLTPGLAFTCDFEMEHSLDVLTDGTRVLGTGYTLEAEKYARFAKPKH
jgi:hypothetical protein